MSVIDTVDGLITVSRKNEEISIHVQRITGGSARLEQRLAGPPQQTSTTLQPSLTLSHSGTLLWTATGIWPVRGTAGHGRGATHGGPISLGPNVWPVSRSGGVPLRRLVRWRRDTDVDVVLLAADRVAHSVSLSPGPGQVRVVSTRVRLAPLLPPSVPSHTSILCLLPLPAPLPGHAGLALTGSGAILLIPSLASSPSAVSRSTPHAVLAHCLDTSQADGVPVDACLLVTAQGVLCLAILLSSGSLRLLVTTTASLALLLDAPRPRRISNLAALAAAAKAPLAPQIFEELEQLTVAEDTTAATGRLFPLGGCDVDSSTDYDDVDHHFVVSHARGATHVRVPWLSVLARRAAESSGGPSIPNAVDLPSSELRLILETDDAAVSLAGVAAVGGSSSTVALHLSSNKLKFVNLSPVAQPSSATSAPTSATPAAADAASSSVAGGAAAAPSSLASLPPPSALPPIPAPPPRLVLRDSSNSDPLRPTTTQVSQVAAAAASVGDTARRLRGAGAARTDRLATLLAIAETQSDVSVALAADADAVRAYSVGQLQRIAALEEVQAVLTERLDVFCRLLRALGEPELSIVERKVFDDLARTAELVVTTHAQIEGLRQLVDDLATRAAETPVNPNPVPEEPLDPALREVLARQTSRIEGLVNEVAQLTNEYRHLVQAS